MPKMIDLNCDMGEFYGRHVSRPPCYSDGGGCLDTRHGVCQ